MDKKNQHNIGQDDQFRKLISETKIKASDNLKFRIMQQIETEKALLPKKTVANDKSLLKGVLSMLGVMYVLIAIFVLSAYGMYGSAILESSTLFTVIVSVASVCSFWGLISVFDERRWMRTRKKYDH